VVGLSPVVWLIRDGGVGRRICLAGRTAAGHGERARSSTGDDAEPDAAWRAHGVFFRYLLQAGLFFAVAVFLSVELGLSASRQACGCCRSRSRLLAARAFRGFRMPRRGRVVRASDSSALSPASVVMIAALDAGRGPEIVTGRCCSQGSVSVRWRRSPAASDRVVVPDEQSGEVGVENT